MSILDEKGRLILKALVNLKIPLAETNSREVYVLTEDDIPLITGTLFICLEPSKNEYTDMRMLYPIFTHEELFKKLMDIVSAGKIKKILVNPGKSAFLSTNPETLREIVLMIAEAKG